VRHRTIAALALPGAVACNEGEPEGPCAPREVRVCGCSQGVEGARVCRFDGTLKHS
jgi:hypothetical protein